MKQYRHKQFEPSSGNFVLGDTFQFNLMLLLQHESAQFDEAEKAGDVRPAWLHFKTHLDLCSQYFKEKDFSKAMYHFYWLGFYANETCQFFTPQEAVKALEALIKKITSESPIVLKESYLGMLREHAQSLASLLWSGDEWKNLPVLEMGVLVRRMLVDESPQTLMAIQKYIPKFTIPKVAAYVKWVRVKKPEHLPKGRRPKK
jgi:hypothetical protein